MGHPSKMSGRKGGRRGRVCANVNGLERGRGGSRHSTGRRQTKKTCVSFRESVLESETPHSPPPPFTGVRITIYFAFETFLRALRSRDSWMGGGGCLPKQMDDVGRWRGGVQIVIF